MINRAANTKKRCTLAVSAMILALLSGGPAADGGGTSVPEVLGGVVGVRAQVPDTARTARTLGTERVGSGVLIDTNGLKSPR